MLAWELHSIQQSNWKRPPLSLSHAPGEVSHQKSKAWERAAKVHILWFDIINSQTIRRFFQHFVSATTFSTRRVLSALSHWASIFGEAEYLPLLAFPFVKLFQNNSLLCFEMVATVLGKPLAHDTELCGSLAMIWVDWVVLRRSELVSTLVWVLP